MYKTKHSINNAISKEMLYNLYVGQNISTRQISKRFNVSANAIIYRLKYFKIPIRNCKDAIKNYYKNIKKSIGHIDKKGYKVVFGKDKCIGSDLRNGILEHRHVMSKHLNRPLSVKEYIHHIDGNKLNNNIKNLYLMNAKEHGQYSAFLIKQYTNKKTFLMFLKQKNRTDKK